MCVRTSSCFPGCFANSPPSSDPPPREACSWGARSRGQSCWVCIRELPCYSESAEAWSQATGSTSHNGEAPEQPAKPMLTPQCGLWKEGFYLRDH